MVLSRRPLIRVRLPLDLWPQRPSPPPHRSITPLPPRSPPAQTQALDHHWTGGTQAARGCIPVHPHPATAARAAATVGGGEGVPQGSANDHTREAPIGVVNSVTSLPRGRGYASPHISRVSWHHPTCKAGVDRGTQGFCGRIRGSPLGLCPVLDWPVSPSAALDVLASVAAGPLARGHGYGSKRVLPNSYTEVLTLGERGDLIWKWGLWGSYRGDW